MMRLLKQIKTAVFPLLILLITACNLPTELDDAIITPESTAVVEATATAVPPGYTRSNPLPGHISHTIANWEVEILDSVRGEKAYHAVLAANQFNDPPPDGWEYLLVRYRVRSLYAGEDKESLGLHVSGDGNVLHYSFNSSAVSPDPMLETYLPGGAESEGWEAYLIQIGEENLIVMVDDVSNYEEPEQYIALAEGNRVTVNEELLNSITPTLVGTDPSEPAPVGLVITTEDWQLSILELYSGEGAWNRIIEANQFNDPPQEGLVYILVKMRLRYIGLEESGELVHLHSDLFTLIDNDGNRYDVPSIVEPEPELDGRLFPGGTLEGWMVLQAPESIIPESRLLFKPRTNSVDNLRYLSLGDYGR
ncbi:MAG: hypothetical protein DWQ04_00850 [Chloroflexi bacterium]|nr:MAG: hypothetical protein DWQ04_00850 [Chloroflexota bacterium]